MNCQERGNAISNCGLRAESTIIAESLVEGRSLPVKSAYGKGKLTLYRFPVAGEEESRLRAEFKLGEGTYRSREGGLAMASSVRLSIRLLGIRTDIPA
jgi:hypothetical protein